MGNDANSPAQLVSESIFPDSAPLINHARSISGEKIGESIGGYRNIGSLLSQRANEMGDKPWLTFYDDAGRSLELTYGEFWSSACRVAAVMSDRLGVRTGDRIATLMSNDPRTVLIYFGAWILGATVVPINCGEDDDRIAFILSNARVVVVFAMSDQLDRCEAIRSRSPVSHYVEVGSSGRSGFLPFDSLVAETHPLSEIPDVPAHTECLIVYTSGTTGPPKGVVLEHYNLLADADSIAEWHGFTANDRAMCVLPIHHVNGTVVTLVTPLYSGGSVVLNNRFRAQSFWRILAQEQCTWCSVVPTVLAFLTERGEDISAYDLLKFRHIICGAGPLTVEVARRFDEAFGVRVVHGYGLSETTCYSCFLPIDLNRQDYIRWMMESGFPSIGCPISANEMAIHDSGGAPLEPSIRGEIVIRGRNVMRCYFLRPDANGDAFAHGWFRSGDEGYFVKGDDGRDYYFITGRIKELIIRGGVNYSPFDIDEVLTRIPGVKAAMAVGFENDFYGEEIGAYVQRESADLTEDDVIAFCRAELPFSKAPKVVVFGDTFPVTSTGKYQRNKLKPLFDSWKSVQFRESKS